jgi:hypothetical protein
MQIPFVGGAYTARSSNLNAQSCINWFPVVDNQDAKTVLAMYGTPGLELFTNLVTGVDQCVRALYATNSLLYAVVNASVFSITTAGVATLLGSLTTSSGFVDSAENGLQVLLVDGTNQGGLITFSTGLLTTVTLPCAATSVTFQDSYFIITEKNSRKFYISSLLDGSTWDALDFATVEGRAANLVAVISNTQDLWFFGEKSIEVYYNSGNVDSPFERISGALVDIGCCAVGTPTKIDGFLYWLSNKKQVCRNQGYQPQFISTPEIEYQIASYGDLSNTQGYTYSTEGNMFYVLAFPEVSKTWVYDTANNYWHEWQSYLSLPVPWGRHRSNCSVQFDGNWIVGDYQNGNLYKLSMDVFTDNGNALRRQRAAQVINKERLNVIHHLLEIDFETGVGLDGDVQGSDPQVCLDWSDDGGHTWSNQHWRSLGKIGAFLTRVRWSQLGMSRNRIYRITISDPVKAVILGAYANLEECKA